MNVNSQVSRRRFLQISGMTAGAAFIAACTAMPASPPAAIDRRWSSCGPAAGNKTMEAWSQMTDVAQESLKGIIDNYNKSNKIGANLEFVYIAHDAGQPVGREAADRHRRRQPAGAAQCRPLHGAAVCAPGLLYERCRECQDGRRHRRPVLRLCLAGGQLQGRVVCPALRHRHPRPAGTTRTS